MLQEFTANLMVQAVGVAFFVIAGRTLWRSKNAAKFLGLLCFIIAASLAYSSTALRIAAAIAAVGYITYRVMRHRGQARKRRQLCQHCGHRDHSNDRCEWRGCRC